VIYSQWIPDRGNYDYYEVAERRGLGDDLPVPSLTTIGPIGAPSTEAGRRAPSSLVKVGSGPFAKGLIMPMHRLGLAGSALGSTGSNVVYGIFLVVAAIAVYRLYDATRH